MQNKNLLINSFNLDSANLIKNLALISVTTILSIIVLFYLGSNLLYLAFLVSGLVYIIIAIVNLELAILILIFAVPFSSGFGLIPSYITVGPITLKFSYLMISLTSLGLAYQLVTRKRKWVNTVLDVPLILFLAICLISIFISVDVGLSIKEFMQISSYILLLLLITNIITTEQLLIKAVTMLFTAVSLAALLGITGVTGQYGPGTEFQVARVVAGFSDPNVGASLLVGTLPLVLSFIINKRISFLLRTSCIFIGILLIVALGLSYSRTGWLLGLFVIISTFLLLGRLRNLPVLFLVVLTVLSAIQLLPSFNERVDQFGADTSSSQRYYLWTAAINIAKQNPMLGIGVGAYPSYLFQHQNEFLGDTRFTISKYPGNWAYNTQKRVRGMVAHNAILQMWAEIGAVGVVVFLLMILIVVANYLKAAFKTSQRSITWFLLTGSAMGFIGVLAQNLTITGLIEHFWILMAFTLVACNIITKLNAKEIKAI